MWKSHGRDHPILMPTSLGFNPFFNRDGLVIVLKYKYMFYFFLFLYTHTTIHHL